MIDSRNNPLDKSNFQLFDPFRNTINTNHLDKTKRQTSERHDNWEGEKEIELRLLESEEDDSGIQSPPLWKNNNPIMHPLSPNSRRREAIIRGQRELMDMVKNIPESCYELSLKDLVEHIPRVQNQEDFLLQEKINNDEEDDEVGVQVHSNRQGSKKFEKKRSIGVENNNNNNKGLFLKMVFPVGNRTKKSIVLLNSSSSKGCSKLDVNGKTSNSNGDDKYWWKKRFSMSSESSGSGSGGSSRRSRSHSRSITSSSSSSNRSTCVRERRSMLNNCMTCFQSSKNQAAE